MESPADYARVTTIAAMVLAAVVVGGALVMPRQALGWQVPYAPAQGGDRFYPVNINNWWGYANQSGKLLIYPQYDWADYFYDEFARVVVRGKTGYLTKANTWYIRPMYPYADRFQDDHAIVGDGKHYGYIDLAGKLIVPVRLAGALRFREGYAAVQVGKRIGYINQMGNAIVTPRFARGRSFHEGVAMVQAFNGRGKPGMLGYIDETGHWVWRDTNQRFEKLGSFYDHLAKAKIGKRWGFIDRSYRLRIAPRFEDARHFEHGLAAVKIQGKWGYINEAGRMQVALLFATADDFDNGILAMISQHGRFGYVNVNGEGGIAARYREAQPFFRKLARVSMPPSFGYIDVSGRVTWDPRWPLNGIVDIGPAGQVMARVNRWYPGNPVLGVPALRPPGAAAYPPNYQYEDILPQPGGAFGGMDGSSKLGVSSDGSRQRSGAAGKSGLPNGAEGK